MDRAAVRTTGASLVKGFVGRRALGTCETWLSQNGNKPGQQHGRWAQRGQKGEGSGKERGLEPVVRIKGPGFTERGLESGGEWGGAPGSKARTGRHAPGVP